MANLSSLEDETPRPFYPGDTVLYAPPVSRYGLGRGPFRARLLRWVGEGMVQIDLSIQRGNTRSYTVPAADCVRV